jgi:hypothetical protein
MNAQSEAPISDKGSSSTLGKFSGCDPFGSRPHRFALRTKSMSVLSVENTNSGRQRLGSAASEMGSINHRYERALPPVEMRR